MSPSTARMRSPSLIQVSHALTVDHLMVRQRDLRRASGRDEALRLHAQFDIVPQPRSGQIRGYFKKGETALLPIEPSILVSTGTSVVHLLGLFAKSDFFFVNAANAIVGYIHYSDLNAAIAKIPFFAIFQAAERSLWDQLRGCIHDKNVERLFGPKKFREVQRVRKRNMRGNVDLSWEGAFTFREILQLARHCKFARLTDRQIRLLTEFRNKCAHSDRTLIESRDGIRPLSEAKYLAEKLSKAAR